MNTKTLLRGLRAPLAVLAVASVLDGALWLARPSWEYHTALAVALVLVTFAVLFWLGRRSGERLRARGVKPGARVRKIIVWVLLLGVPALVNLALLASDRYYDYFGLMSWLEMLTGGLFVFFAALFWPWQKR